MNIFSELKFAVYILFFMTQFSAMFRVEADKIECIKSDECSCKTKTTPQQEISLWTIKTPGRRIYSDVWENWRYDINLCHGINKNINAPDGGCRNSTVCQYNVGNKSETFELGHLGSAKFGQYDSETKSIILKYTGISQEKKIRRIEINLICTEDGSATHAVYLDVESPIFHWGAFQTKIETKAACLRRVIGATSITPTSSHSTPTSSRSTPTSSHSTPTSSRSTPTSAHSTPTSSRSTPTSSRSTPTSSPCTPASSRITPTSSHIIPTSSRIAPTSSHIIPTSHGRVSSNGGLKTIYIVLIVVAGLLLILAVGSYAAYKMVVRRKRGLLLEEEENEDDGTVPRLNIQNAPTSGPV